MQSKDAGLPCPGCRARFATEPDLLMHRKLVHGWPLDTQRDGQVAEVVLTRGRYFLRVAGIYVAMETGICRDGRWVDRGWTAQMLREAADTINGGPQ